MLKHTTTSSQGGSCSDVDSSRSNRMSNSSFDESFEAAPREDVVDNATSGSQHNRNLTLDLRNPHTQMESLQKPRTRCTSFTNISTNDEEFLEEVQKGDKTLTYYKRRSISPAATTPPDVPPRPTSDEMGLNIQRSSAVKSPVRYEENFWKSEDDLLPRSPPKTKNKNEKTKTKTPVVVSEKWETNSPQTPCVVASQYARDFNQSKYRIFSPTRRSKPNSVDENFEKEKANHYNSSIHSDDSFERRYLDLSGDRYDMSVIVNRNIRTTRKQRPPSVSADSSVSKYLSNVSSNTESRECRSPGSLSMTPPVEVSEVNNNNMRPSNISYGDINTSKILDENREVSIQITINRRIQICKYIAIFSVILTSIVCVLVGILHFYVGYYPETLHLNQGDVKLVAASAFFCSNVKAVSRSSSLRVIAFKRKSRMKEMKNTITGSFRVEPSGVWSRDFHLIKGSDVRVKINTVYSTDVFVFQSEKKFSIWSQRKQSETYLKRLQCCSDTKSKEKTLYFNATKDGRYFIAIYNHVEIIPVNVYLEMTFVRESYDFTDMTHHCLSETPGVPCSVDYSFNNGEYAALEIPLSKEASTIPRSSEVEWECVARIWFYVVLFIVIFIVISAGIITCYHITATICIPSRRYCCVISTKKHDKSMEFIYHNKYAKKKNKRSDVPGDGLVNLDPSQLSSTLSNKLPLYYQIDADIYPTKSSSTQNQDKNYITKKEQRIQPGIATIPERSNRDNGDPADSGIGVDYTPSRQSYKESVDYTPSRQSYRQEIIKLRELQIQQLKSTKHYPPHKHTSAITSRDNCSFEDT